MGGKLLHGYRLPFWLNGKTRTNRAYIIFLRKPQQQHKRDLMNNPLGFCNTSIDSVSDLGAGKRGFDEDGNRF